VRRRVLAGALGVVALAALALGRAPGRPPAAPVAARPVASPPAEAAEASPRAVDPDAIRDLFRFAGEAPRLAREVSDTGAEEEEPNVASLAPSGPHLVGLVSRGGRRLAALAADGEVELAGPGETAAGVTVLTVDDEGVRIRRADGTEETLVLP
jgi:hypothetical protein